MVFISELRLVCGLGKALGDSSSAESEQRVLDLMHTGIGGFSVGEDGYVPALPALKGAGQWADTALVDGRELIAGVVGNVVETVTLTATAGTLESRYTLERVLFEFTRLTRAFHTADYQHEPVYVRFRAFGAPGPQYALLYDLSIAQAGDPFDPTIAQEVTLSWEREPYWRAVAPGKSPKLWTFEKRGLDVGKGYTLNDLSLIAGIDHLGYKAQVDNLREWNSTYTGFLTTNYIDIPAADIPGDAPALVELAILPLVGDVSTIYIARQTGPTGFVGRGWSTANSAINTTSVLRYNTFNAGESTIVLNTGSSLVNNASGPRNAAGTRQYFQCDFSLLATTYTARTTWGRANNTATSLYDTNLNAGKYACFLRAHQTGGANNTIQMRLAFESRTGTALITLPSVYARIDASGYDLYYMGVIDIPYWVEQFSDPRGYGKASGESADIVIKLEAVRASGAGVLIMTDLILMPIDECMVGLVSDDQYPVDGNHQVIYDNTGYLNHGKTESVCALWQASTFNLMRDYPQIIGQDLTLLPGVNNRLYLLGFDQVGDAANLLTLGYTVRLNIVPRWSGIRND